MGFEIMLVSGPSITGEDDLAGAALPFLKQVGYLPEGYDPRTGASTVLESVPYRLFAECFLGKPDKVWSVGELSRRLGTTIPTVYRHLDKLALLDLLGEGSLERDASRKGYFLRYHDLSRAWRFTELNAELALENYRRAVDAVQKALGARKPQASEAPKEPRPEGDFSLKVVNFAFDPAGDGGDLLVDLLLAVDYLSDMAPFDPKEARSGPAFRLLADCLLRRPDPGWTIEELSTAVGSPKPTVYRYLRRLGQLGVLEKGAAAEPAPPAEGEAAEAVPKVPAKRRFRLKRGNLSKAWNFTEYQARIVMKNYRRTVDHLAELASGEKVR